MKDTMFNRTHSANEDSYWPPEFNDDAFKRWAIRVSVKLLNLPPGSPDHVMRHLLLTEGVPSVDWVNALGFIGKMAEANKRDDAFVEGLK